NEPVIPGAELDGLLRNVPEVKRAELSVVYQFGCSGGLRPPNPPPDGGHTRPAQSRASGEATHGGRRPPLQWGKPPLQPKCTTTAASQFRCEPESFPQQSHH